MVVGVIFWEAHRGVGAGVIHCMGRDGAHSKAWRSCSHLISKHSLDLEEGRLLVTARSCASPQQSPLISTRWKEPQRWFKKHPSGCRCRSRLLSTTKSY